MFRAALTTLILLAMPSAAAPQGLTPAEIDAAIAAGLAGKRLQSQCNARGGLATAFSEMGGGFDVIVEGPVGRIQRMAADAKKNYKPFTPADVTEAMRAPVLHVIAYPYAPSRQQGGGWQRTAAAENLVLKRKDATGDNPADVLQPTATELLPASWSNALGGTWDGQGIDATFDFAAFKALPGDEIDIVVITPAGERRCKIGKKDRATLR